MVLYIKRYTDNLPVHRYCMSRVIVVNREKVNDGRIKIAVHSYISLPVHREQTFGGRFVLFCVRYKIVHVK